MEPWPLPRMTFAPDGLSWALAGLAWVLTLSVGWHLRVQPPPGGGLTRRRGIFLGGFVLAATGTVTAGDWFSFLLFAEMSSLCLFLLAWEGDRRAAALYLAAQFAGAVLVAAGTAWSWAETGSLAWDALSREARPLVWAGLGLKGALLGLHGWLPEAHSRAPAPVSALLSGFGVKVGVYGMIRLVHGEDPLLLGLGGAASVYGVIRALGQRDAKRLLAFHTVSQLGYATAALGTGTLLGKEAAGFFLVVHGLFKGLLFLCVGVLERAYGTRDLALLGGAAKALPGLGVLFGVGAWAIAGLPGGSGFLAKGLVKGSLPGTPLGVWTGGLFVLAGVGTVLSFCKLGVFGFLRSPTRKPEGSERSSVSLRSLQGMGILAGATLILGILPAFPLVLAAGPVRFPPLGAAWGQGFLGVGLFLLGGEIWVPGEGRKGRRFPGVLRFLCLGRRGLRKIHGGGLRGYLAVLVLLVLVLLGVLQ